MMEPHPDPVWAYADDVIAGRIVAGRLVRLACERHKRDLEFGHERGLTFDVAEAIRAIRFFHYLTHWKGPLAGQPFELLPWEAFCVGSIFGWRRADGTRRFRTAYSEIGKKNGKSSLAGGIALFTLMADREAGAEVYAVATTKRQALQVFNDSRTFVQGSPDLNRRLMLRGDERIDMPSSRSKYQPLSNDKTGADGVNVHCAIIDEIHRHRDRGMIDILEYGTAARRQPLIFMITTAGDTDALVCFEQRDYGVKVLEDVLADDALFVYIAAMDPGDDWTDLDHLAKANPSLDHALTREYLAQKLESARGRPAAQNSFRRYHANEWVSAATRWIDSDAWKACGRHPGDPDVLRGRPCYVGLDLSMKNDLTALVYGFPPDDDPDGLWRFLPFFFMPAEKVERHTRRDRAPYDVWAREGYLITTPGEVIDFELVRDVFFEQAESYRVLQVPHDPWNAAQFCIWIEQEGFTPVEVTQTAKGMSEPAKELEALIESGKIAHGNHPVLTWCAHNVAVVQDRNGNYLPAKDKSTGRIDGIIGMILAISRGIVAEGERPKTLQSVEVLVA